MRAVSACVWSSHASHTGALRKHRESLARARRLATSPLPQANYAVQRLLELGTTEHRAKLARALKGHVLQLSLHMYGCRVIQKALEVLGEEAQCDMVGAAGARRCAQLAAPKPAKLRRGDRVHQPCRTAFWGPSLMRL